MSFYVEFCKKTPLFQSVMQRLSEFIIEFQPLSNEGRTILSPD